MIFLFCPIFVVNSIFTFLRYCCYIYTDIEFMIYYNFLMILTKLLFDVLGKLRSYFYLFQNVLLTFSFLHPTENVMRPFQHAGILLFFGLWCFCLISKCSHVLNNFGHYFHAKAFQIPLTILFSNFWLCLLKLLVKVTAMSVKYLF